MKKINHTNVKPYNYEDENMPCCVQDSGFDGEISDELKQLIDERLDRIEKGLTKFIPWEEVERNFELRKQAFRHKQQDSINV